MKYAWIKKHKRLFPTVIMSRVLKVSTSGYYDSIKRDPCSGQIRRRTIAQAAAHSYFESWRIYGHRKVHEDLLEEGIICCKETVRRIMRRIGLYSRIKHKFIATTDSNHTFKIAKNLLGRDFTSKAPNHKWAADITYIPTKMGWLYLAVVMDLFSRRIVGWSMSDTIDSKLVQSAMKMAILHRRPVTDLIHHSDRGVQYASEGFQELLDDNNVVCSMSRKGNCWDNACAESFFGSLKNEWVKGKIYETFEDGEKDIFKYVEVFYNRKRRHASLGYVSPVVYEEMHEMKQERAA
ncbi:MAG: IS3 family transposase [Planctomycetes bacterium]|nr:IS3 family transposase [Planctomycetota bacterium]